MQQRLRNAWCLAILPVWVACAMVVDPEDLALRCQYDADSGVGDPCLAVGLHCIEGMCQACDASATEICNGQDDDCDAKIDEGHDADNDGFTWCGGGIPELADCVPSDASIHPPSLEADGSRGSAPMDTCGDGKDNDCDSRVDEECAAMATCAETGCSPDKRCDVTTGVCIEPREVGSGCLNHSDCKDGFCLRPGEEFGLNVALMDGRCASACCSNADCDEGSICMFSSSGARACLPRNIVGLRSKGTGERCLLDSECASAICSQTRCLERCFRTEGCSANACVLSSALVDARAWLCGPPVGNEIGGQLCLPLLSTCLSGLCTDTDGTDTATATATATCAVPCGRDVDCGDGERCAYGEVLSVRGSVSNVPMCVRAPPSGTEGLEPLCCTNDDCGDQLCMPNAADAPVWHMSCRKP